MIEARVPEVQLGLWAGERTAEVETALKMHGAILFRGFGGMSVAAFESFVRATCGELLDYTHRSTPRTRVSGGIFTSTEYPADQEIALHNEMAYTRAWPERIAFCCIEPPDEGGETPIADSRAVLQRLSESVQARFERSGVMYVRNYGEGVDLSWQEVFQTSHRIEVEAYCRDAGISVEWKPGDRLRTRQVCQSTTKHAQTGQRVWFNQAHLFHFTNLAPEVQRSLLSMLAPEDLPRNTYYGDGAPIEPETLEEIRAAYRAEEVAFSWRRGDVLLMDNVLAAHGRRPFAGRRKIVVGMAMPSTRHTVDDGGTT